MKRKKQKMGLILAAALVGASQIASAENLKEDFIPLENLPPNQRIVFESQVRLLDQSLKVDWESVVVGVNERGELVLKDRKLVNLAEVSQPTCFTR